MTVGQVVVFVIVSVFVSVTDVVYVVLPLVIVV